MTICKILDDSQRAASGRLRLDGTDRLLGHCTTAQGISWVQFVKP